MEVVGVVGNTRYRTLTGPPEPLIFVALGQHLRPRAVLHARVHNAATMPPLERSLREADARIIFDRTGTIDQWFEESRAAERYTQWIGGAIGVLQLALAMMGLWALVAYAVERRTAEIGVRLALGAFLPARRIVRIDPAMALRRE